MRVGSLHATRFDLVIGLDGGGSRTRVRLANLRGETLGEGNAGTSNPYARGFHAAESEIIQAVSAAFAQAGLESQKVFAACFGLGGADRPEDRETLNAWGKSVLAERVKTTGDGEIVLAAGTTENWGVALIAGTGSSAWARARDGRMVRAGGWGYLIGDEGSAFDLVRRALQAVVQAADGRGMQTALREAMLGAMNLREPMQLIGRVYRPEARPADLAELAPVVLATAEAGDETAYRIVRRAGAELGRTVLAAAGAASFSGPAIPLALTGGLLLGSETMRRALLDALAGGPCRFEPVEMVYAPVAGAVRLALELAKDEQDAGDH